VRSSSICCWLSIPFLAIILSSCSKEGGGSNPKIHDKVPEIKKVIPGGGDNKGVDDVGKPTPN